MIFECSVEDKAIPHPLMTPEEEAYEKALRRIREAEDAGALELKKEKPAHGRSPNLNH